MQVHRHCKYVIHLHWGYIHENRMLNWLNTIDPNLTTSAIGKEACTIWGQEDHSWPPYCKIISRIVRVQGSCIGEFVLWWTSYQLNTKQKNIIARLYFWLHVLMAMLILPWLAKAWSFAITLFYLLCLAMTSPYLKTN